MSLRDNENVQEFGKVLHQGYRATFITQWPPMRAAILIGVLSVVSLAWARPWGVAGGLRIWGDWLLYGLGLYESRPFPVLLSSNSLMTMGLMWGALAAFLISRDFAIRTPPRLELIKGVVGGCLLGVGAALSGGCNVGGFYSSISSLSLSGFAMLAGLLVGAWVGLKYLYWEMEHLAPLFAAPQAAPAAADSTRRRFDWTPVKPWLGWLLLGAGYAAYALYRFQGYVELGGVLLCGMGFGFILGRSRFCFARCFREPFMTGEAEIPKAVIVSLMLSVVGCSVIKWSGLRPEALYVTPTFGLGALAGGFIFGFGMLLAGGCGSGTAWRAAEGQVKLMAALIFFCVFNSLTKACMNASETLRSLVGTRVFMPDYLGYQGSVALILFFLAAWYAIVTWNERTDAMVVEM